MNISANNDGFVNLTANSSLGQILNGFIPPEVEVDTLPIITKLNEEEALRQTPLLVFLGFISLVGISGNIVVWYIYGFLYTASNSRIFITCLAVVDLCTCVLAVPVEMVTVRNQYQFDAPWTCRISRFTNTATTTSSAAVLLLIAMDRYRKICRPLNWQFSNTHAKLLCLGAICVGVFLAWPSLVLYGVKSTEIKLRENLNGTATECSIDDSYSKTLLALVYNLAFLLSFLASIVIIIVLYTLIGQKVRFFAQKHEHRRGSSSDVLETDNSDIRRTRKEKLREIQTEVSSYDEVDDSLRLKRNGTLTFNKSTENIVAKDRENTNTVSEIETTEFAQEVSTCNSNAVSIPRNMSTASTLPLSSASTKIKKKRKALARNTTYLMFIISVVFVLNFVPYLVVVLVREASKDFVAQLSHVGRTAYRFFLRSYFLNAAVNPVLYSIFDRRFRTACRKCICNIRTLLCMCRRPS